MNHKIKALGIFLTAMSLTVAMASTAQAQFTSTSSNTWLTGSQIAEQHKFTAGAGIGAITCTTVNVEGFMEAKSVSELILRPQYEGCKDSLGRTVDITNGETFWNGSFYVWINYLTHTLTSGAGKGTAHLKGKFVLTVTGSTHCTITLQNPQTSNGFTYTNNEDGTVTLSTQTNNIHSSISGGFFACGTAATTSNTGTYTGKTRFLTGGPKFSVD